MIHRSAEDRARLTKLKAEIRVLEKPNTEANRKLRRKLREDRQKAIGKPAKGQRQPRVRDNAYLAFLRRQPCLFCERSPCDAAHVRWAPTGSGWRYVGKGEKPDDARAVPLCRECHTWQHSVSESYFWDAHLQRDPVQTCADLYAAFMAQSSKASQTSVASDGEVRTCEASQRPNTNTTTPKDIDHV